MRGLIAILIVCLFSAPSFAAPGTQQAAPKPQVSTPVATSPLASGAKSLANSYRAHRGSFVTAAKYSENVRRNRLLALGAILVFAFLTLPRSARGARDFYRQMIATSPLPDFPDASDEDIRRTRSVLFFYLLFLLYQIVAFPLTLGRDNIIQFSSDLAFQAVLLAALIWTYQSLKRHLRSEWRDDPARREKMDTFLNEKLEGMNIKWRNIQLLALGVFAVGFAPVTVAHLPDWLDAISALAERFA
jgi:hypothetical protein